MGKSPMIGPTFEEMLHPDTIDPRIRKRAARASGENPNDPINLFNIAWRDAAGKPRAFVMPRELTGIEANVIVLYGKDFPSGSHKVGATYSILAEKTVRGEVDPNRHVLVWPSTGNYGIGGAWVGRSMNYRSVVVLPEMMSRERFDLIRSYGAEVIATPGCESNVKEIYDKTKELAEGDPERVRILNQFQEFGNYRFHWFVTGNAMAEIVRELGTGNGKIAAVVSAVGSAGTIASGDRAKQLYPESKTVAVEPVQCPTISMNGYGGHDIQGIGDKHVTWIHDVMNTDAVVQVDDTDCKKMLEVIASPEGSAYLDGACGRDAAASLSDKFGISGIANLIGAIKTAKYYRLGPDDNIVTIATDGIDRYRSVLRGLAERFGPLDGREAAARTERIFLDQEPSRVFEGDRTNRERWHNLKYFTWVEQQGKTVEELDALRKRAFWEKERALVAETDSLIAAFRDSHPAAIESLRGTEP